MRKKRLATAVFAIAAVSSAIVCSSRAPDPHAPACRVRSISGDVQGMDRGASCAFLGIPFAAPPVGPLRWKPPQPLTPWAPATLNATLAPPSCPLIDPPGTGDTRGDEDCLKLNVWLPDPPPSSPAAVIVWIHTGAFVATSANFPAHDGQHMAERTGAIVVAPNYRIGPLGFLGHRALTAEDAAYRSSGNYGFLDQRAALAWVRNHIAAFGGDPHNVTIAGQSAGAHSVSLHLVSPGSPGYFQRAIMQSGYASTRWRTLAEAESQGERLAAALGCADSSHVLACMRSKTLAEVLLALPSGRQQFAETSRAAWGPVVDGLDVPDQPRRLYETGAFSRVPVLIGSTKDEGWTYVDRSFPGGLTADVYGAAVETEFGTADVAAVLATYPLASFESPKHALAQMTGDVETVCEARRVARLIERTHTPVYLYSFERTAAAVAGDHVIHGLDTNFVFGNDFGNARRYALNDDDRALSGRIGRYWMRFASTGVPNGRDESGVHWPAFTARLDEEDGPDTHIVLDWPVRAGRSWRDAECDFWEPFFLRSVAGSVPASKR